MNRHVWCHIMSLILDDWVKQEDPLYMHIYSIHMIYSSIPTSLHPSAAQLWKLRLHAVDTWTSTAPTSLISSPISSFDSAALKLWGRRSSNRIGSNLAEICWLMFQWNLIGRRMPVFCLEFEFYDNWPNCHTLFIPFTVSIEGFLLAERCQYTLTCCQVQDCCLTHAEEHVQKTHSARTCHEAGHFSKGTH